MPSNSEILMEMAKAFLDGSMPFDQFETAYREYYFGKAAEKLQLRDEIDLYGDIIERLDWTARSPGKIDRQDGWMDRDQFREWLVRRIAGES